MTYAPIALFTYNRADHTQKAIESLLLNAESKESDLFIFSDGPKNEKAVDGVKRNREYIHEIKKLEGIAFKSVTLIEREKNWGLANSLIAGITDVINQYGKIIVVEDDLILSPFFLKFMNEGLEKYNDEDRVGAISAYIYSDLNNLPNTFFLRHFHCWGWATWRRAWQHMDMSMEGINKVSVWYMIRRIGILPGIFKYYRTLHKYKHIAQYSAWAARWDLSILVRDGIGICPGVNLSENIGMAEGEHYSDADSKRPEALVKISPFVWPIVYNDSMRIDERQKRLDIRTFWKERWFGLKKMLKCSS